MAGLPRPVMSLDSRVEGGAGSPAYELLAETVRSLLPLMERLGLATAADVQPDTLAARIEAEVCAGGGVIILPPLIGAWARMPEHPGVVINTPSPLAGEGEKPVAAGWR